MSDQFLRRQLYSVDWDFLERGDADLSAIHWYPGSFAPGLPGVLVDLLSAPDDVVFDPFCGVGSTAADALLRGRSSISCDVNLIGLMAGLSTAGLISLLLLSPALFHQVFDDLQAIVDDVGVQNALLSPAFSPNRDIDDHVNFYGDASLQNISDMLFKPIKHEYLERWYESRTLDELVRLIGALEAAKISSFSKLVGLTMVSAIARATSSETRSWGHIADNVRPKTLMYKSVRNAASGWLVRTRKQLVGVRPAARFQASPPHFEFRLVNWKIDNPVFESTPISLLLTSPPYGGAIDYGLAQRLSLYLFGMADDALGNLVDMEIGARRKRFRSNHVDMWAGDLVKAINVQLEGVKPGGYAVFVMPHKDHGRDAGERLLKEALDLKGWRLGFAFDRSVRQSRTRQSWTSIKKETILIFRTEV